MKHQRCEPSVFYTLASYYKIISDQLGINIARAIRTVHVNAIFVTEEAKQARDTHWYMRNSTSSTQLTS